MSGYNGFSMSNNAIAAYDAGLMPASKIGHGIPAELIQKYCRYIEWHHCSSRFNIVEFYDPEKVLATFGLITREDYESNPEAIAALKKYKEDKKKKEVKTYENCTIEWLEWGGTRKHPTATECRAEGATVTHDGGQFVKIKLVDGREFKKKIYSNGFSVRKENYGRLF